MAKSQASNQETPEVETVDSDQAVKDALAQADGTEATVTDSSTEAVEQGKDVSTEPEPVSTSVVTEERQVSTTDPETVEAAAQAVTTNRAARREEEQAEVVSADGEPSVSDLAARVSELEERMS